MELNRRELLKSLAGGAAALAVVGLPLAPEACAGVKVEYKGDYVIAKEVPAKAKMWRQLDHQETVEMVWEDILDENGMLMDKLLIGYRHRVATTWRGTLLRKGRVTPPPKCTRIGYTLERSDIELKDSGKWSVRLTIRIVQSKLFTNAEEANKQLKYRGYALG